MSITSEEKELIKVSTGYTECCTHSGKHGNNFLFSEWRVCHFLWHKVEVYLKKNICLYL